MKKIFTLILAVSTLLIYSELQSQDSRGARLYKYYDYAEAIPKLKKSVQTKKSGWEADLSKLADSYRRISNMEAAKDWYRELVALPGIEPIEHYRYAQVLYNVGDYTQAKAQFDKYFKLTGDKKSQVYSGFCDEVVDLLRKPSFYEVTNAVDLNTKQADFSPYYLQHEILFSSDRGENLLTPTNYGWTGREYVKIYSTEQEGYNFTTPKIYSYNINQMYHDGVTTTDEDESIIFFTRTEKGNVPKDEDNIKTYRLKLYSSNKVDGKWTKPEAFYLNDPMYSVGHPSLSADGQTLFFVSDKPGGFGGTDIYYCKREGDSWGEAINLGSTINTMFDEMFPNIFGKKLYFSSDGHLGIGGLDVFISEGNGTSWSKPLNLRKPLNSTMDDFGFVFDRSEEDEGLFSSNRAGGVGADDIYIFSKNEIVLEEDEEDEEEELVPLKAKVCVTDKTTGKPMPGSTVFQLDRETSRVHVYKTGANGCAMVDVFANKNYSFKALHDNYGPDCGDLRVGNAAPTGTVALELENIELGKVFKLENIYYDLDKDNIRPDAAVVLDQLVATMLKNPITIELRSHTDSRASDAYNMDLSQRRAQSAVNYLISHGINANRMTAKGYGESMLVNECSNGVRCSEAKHQDNRRTEFVVLDYGETLKVGYDKMERYLEGDIYDLNYFEPGFFTKCQ